MPTGAGKEHQKWLENGQAQVQPQTSLLVWEARKVLLMIDCYSEVVLGLLWEQLGVYRELAAGKWGNACSQANGEGAVVVSAGCGLPEQYETTPLGHILVTGAPWVVKDMGVQKWAGLGFPGPSRTNSSSVESHRPF